MSAEKNDAPASHEPELREGDEAPPRGVFAMALVRWAILLLAAVLAGSTIWSYVHDGHGVSAASARYYCPMHPQVTSDAPGECPICHMTLELIPTERLGGGDAGTDAVHSDAGEAPPDTAPLSLSLDRVQAIGVRTSPVVAEEVAASFRVTATVAAPEQGAAEVHARAAGYVERIAVQETGIHVKRGQEMLAIYSPEIYQAEAELLATRNWEMGDAGAGVPSPARQKLELLGMTPAAIEHVLATGKPIRAVSVSAPTDGFVAKKAVVLGSYVTPEMPLFELVDLSRVYVVADVFQRDVGKVKVGTVGRFVSTSHPEVAIEAKVDLVYPTLSPDARTTRVRMQVKNPGMKLRPGEYGTVELSVPARRALIVPRDALIDTGRATYVFVDQGGGNYAPRTVAVAGESERGIEIASGVREGEHVVAGATFLLDSESRIQSSLSQKP